MHLELITLLGEKVNEPVYDVIIPTADGEIAVFPGHESLISIAMPGVLAVRRQKIDNDEHLEYFAISGGVIEITGQRVRILVDEADAAPDIIEAESRAALEAAMQLRDQAKNQMELEKASRLIDRHAIRLRVAGLRRHHRR